MAIKRLAAEPPAQETPVQKIKRVTKDSSSGERITKEQLQDKLALFTLNDFDAEHLGSYGVTPKAEIDVLVVESGEKHRGMWVFGNLALQVSDGLEAGETSLGKIVSGPNKSGNGQWFGVTWSDDDAEFELAEAALAAAEGPQY